MSIGVSSCSCKVRAICRRIRILVNRCRRSPHRKGRSIVCGRSSPHRLRIGRERRSLSSLLECRSRGVPVCRCALLIASRHEFAHHFCRSNVARTRALSHEIRIVERHRFVTCWDVKCQHHVFASRQLFVAHAVVDGHAKFAEDAVAHVAFQAVEVALEIEQIFRQTASHPRIVHAQEQRTALRIEHAAHHLHQVVGLFLQVGAHIVVGRVHRARLKFQSLSFASEGVALWQIHFDVEQLFDLLANLLLLSFEGEARSEVEGENETRQLHESV